MYGVYRIKEFLYLLIPISLVYLWYGMTYSFADINHLNNSLFHNFAWLDKNGDKIHMIFTPSLFLIFFCLFDIAQQSITDVKSYYPLVAIRNNSWFKDMLRIPLQRLALALISLLAIHGLMESIQGSIKIDSLIHITVYYLKLYFLFRIVITLALTGYISNDKLLKDSKPFYLIIGLIVVDYLFSTSLITLNTNILIDVSMAIIYSIVTYFAVGYLATMIINKGDVL